MSSTDFNPDRIYELIYPAKNPMVMGLGYVVTRDLASFFRYQAHDEAGNPNPLALRPTERRAFAAPTAAASRRPACTCATSSISGFNEDESHRKVFDAVQIVIPGTHRLLANVEFADPNTYSRQDVWHDSVSYSYPPLTFAVTTDPISGIRDGILKRPATDPLVFQVDSANEFWQMNASLNVHDAQNRPVPIPDNVRLYFASSFQHGGVAGLLNPPGAAGMCEVRRKATAGRRRCAPSSSRSTNGPIAASLPPKSNYPTLEDNTLVSLNDGGRHFPAIPRDDSRLRSTSCRSRTSVRASQSTGGRITPNPPTLGARYPLYVPKPDADGLDVAGIRRGRSRARRRRRSPDGTCVPTGGGRPISAG